MSDKGSTAGETRATMAGAMDGVRVLDLTIALSGPMAMGILADQGADVIKVEPPGLGDIGRWVGVAAGGVSAMSQMSSRGKRSIALNLHEEDGRAILRELVADADVFAQNFRPGVIEKLGFGYEEVARLNSEIVYLSISGFGPHGPYAARSAYDPVVQAVGGLAAAQAPAEGEPQLIRNTAADKISGLTAAQAVSAALFARARGRGGQHVELAMMDAVVQFVWQDAAGNEVLLDSDGSQPSSFSRDQKLWPTRDGWVIAAPVSDADVAGICRAVEVDGWDVPELRTIVDRRIHGDLFRALLKRVMDAVQQRTTAEVMEAMGREKAPAGAVLAPAEQHLDPQLQAMETFEESVHPTAGRLRQPRPAARFSATPARTGGPCPTLGENSDEILRELGRGDAIADLRARGIVA